MENCNNCKNKCENGLDKIIEKHADKSDNLIICLQQVQDFLGYISKESVTKVSKALKVAESEVYGVVTFYSQFRTEPNAKYVIDVCMGTACYVLGANDIMQEFCNQLKVRQGEVSSDGKWLVTSIRCLGCCGLAPVVSIGGKIYGNVQKSDISRIIKETDIETVEA